MGRMIFRRLLAIVPLLIVVSMLMFGLTALLPGDPAQTLAGAGASPDRVDEIRATLGLDRSFVARYLDWMGDALRGDLGTSLFTRRPVRTELADRLPVTAAIVAGALMMSIVVGFPLGLLAGRRPGGFVDRLATSLATLGVAVPHFVFGIILIVVFAIKLKWLPIAGYVSVDRGGWFEWAKHLVLPSIALAGLLTADITRQLRSGIVETLDEDYIRTARAKGLRDRTVLTRHALRMASGPTIAVTAVHAARLFGGSVVIEELFSLPGLGGLTAEAVLARDLPLIYGIVPLTVLFVVVVTLAADLLHLSLNPRLREVPSDR